MLCFFRRHSCCRESFMRMAMEKGDAFLALILLPLFVSGVSATTKFTFMNNCGYPVWPGTLNNFGSPALSQTGFKLDQGVPFSLDAPTGWSGRFWGRTGCTGADGSFNCKSADCGNQVACNGRGGAPPATLVEIDLDNNNGQDTYDTSLVDGFNVPFSIRPQGGTGTNCAESACAADINAICPQNLKVTGDGGETVGCKSACAAFNTDEFCCRGAFEPRGACNPNEYSIQFKNACPSAYSYAHDDETSTFSCKAPEYILTFCP